MRRKFITAMNDNWFLSELESFTKELTDYGYSYSVAVSVSASDEYSIYFAVTHYSKGLKFYWVQYKAMIFQSLSQVK